MVYRTILTFSKIQRRKTKMKVERTIVIKENEISEEVGQYEKEITKLLAEILMKTENIMVDKSDSLGYTS
jgi:hypothetical protein